MRSDIIALQNKLLTIRKQIITRHKWFTPWFTQTVAIMFNAMTGFFIACAEQGIGTFNIINANLINANNLPHILKFTIKTLNTFNTFRKQLGVYVSFDGKESEIDVIK